MPRARTTTTEDLLPDAPKKRAPRKRVTPVDGEVVTPRPRAPRRKVVVEEEMVVETPRVADVPTGRRAPTLLRAERTASSKSRRSLIIAAAFFFVFTGIGVGIGISDSGQIDVVAVVNERNERVNRGEVREGESTMTVPVQSGDIRPNGGLVPADPSALPPLAPETASTTDATASSTEEGTATSSEATTTEPTAGVEANPNPEAST